MYIIFMGYIDFENSLSISQNRITEITREKITGYAWYCSLMYVLYTSIPKQKPLYPIERSLSLLKAYVIIEVS